MSETVIIILGMTAVTYLPRLLPFFMLSRARLSPPVQRFLRCIPAAAIGALIFPGLLSATPEFPAASLAGMGFTLLYGIYRGGIIIPVLGAVGTAYLVLNLPH